MERLISEADLNLAPQGTTGDHIEVRDELLEAGFTFFRQAHLARLARGCNLSEIVMGVWARFVQLDPDPEESLEQSNLSQLDTKTGQDIDVENSNIRVLFVDSPSVVTDGLQLVLMNAGMMVVGIIDNKEEAAGKARELLPNLIITESRLQNGASGIDAVKAIHADIGDIPVVFLTDQEDSLSDAVEAGAYGFLSKSQPAEVVIRTVRKVAQGEYAIPAEKLAALLIKNEMQSEQLKSRKPDEPLTNREQEVLGLMERGLDNNAIAKRLVISYTTVRSHVQNILEKTGTHSKLEAVARANEYGLLTPPNGQNGQSQ